ncbi:MAG: oxidoreductase [Armatimonadetes bacterium CG_4_9_14_3_um_filter_66_14]|nr:MAG: oxidoreductase [Armatimonadetes bacterium CG_4_9_14_3_um_filter_66_14]
MDSGRGKFNACRAPVFHRLFSVLTVSHWLEPRKDVRLRLKLGIIGYGGRASGMAKNLGVFDIPYRVAAVADPRWEEIKGAGDEFLKDAVFYENADDLLAQEELDGVMVGTRCFLHTEMACKVATRNVPLFLEKPVAISFEQVARLDKAFQSFTAPSVVSFPLRLSPIVLTVKEMIEAGEIGQVEHAVAFNDVPYAAVYYTDWYRNYDEVGGLFLQKATHDLDYLYYLVGHRPKWICAMKAQRVYGGDKPFDLKCKDCEEQDACPESPFNWFYKGFQGNKLVQDDSRLCMFAEGIRNEDQGNCLVEYENGAQVSYTQNFFARFKSAQRGARLYGYKGTIYFDWYRNQIQLYKHQSPVVKTIDFTGNMPHFGGDRELCFDFLLAMKEGRPSRSPIEAGILSALTCLWARESAETRKFCEIVMPQGCK